jgi:hypothetical protein
MSEIAEGLNLESAIRFTRHNFDNFQSLVRLADAKGAGIITIWILMVGSTLSIGRAVFNTVPWCQWKIWYVIFTIIMAFFGILLIVLAVLVFQQVFLPRSPKHYADVIPERDLMCFEHVLNHRTQDSYRDAIENMNPSLELRNLSDQVYELAHIVNQKMAGLRSCYKWLIFSLILWFVLAALSLFIA